MQEPPERPKGHDSNVSISETMQAWTEAGESCPEGTIPIRRTTEEDVLRASSARRFGRKIKRGVRRDTTSSDHEVCINKVILHYSKKKRKKKYLKFLFCSVQLCF